MVAVALPVTTVACSVPITLVLKGWPKLISGGANGGTSAVPHGVARAWRHVVAALRAEWGPPGEKRAGDRVEGSGGAQGEIAGDGNRV